MQKNAPPPCGHVCQAIVNIFKLVQDIMWTNLLTKFHDVRTINVTSRVLSRFYYSYIRKNAPSPGVHVFQPTRTIFKLVQHIIEINLLTKFHEDRTTHFACRVLTIFYYSHVRKNAEPPGGNAFQPT